MKSKLYIQNESKKIIIFFAGWGVDTNPFHKEILSSKKNILFIYDYTGIEISPELKEILSDDYYTEISVIAWSMGVMVANTLLQGHKLKNAIAINGTLEPISDKYGIYERIFDLTINSFNDETAINFAKRMCLSDYNKYKENFPERINLKEELLSLKQYAQNKNKSEKNIFTNVIISENDKIIPPKHQLDFWKTKGIIPKILKDSPHFCFYTHKLNWFIELS